MEFMPTRRNWKEPRPNPFKVLFPEVHGWVRGGAHIQTVWIYIALAFFTLLFYAPVAWHDFISLADYDYVRDNSRVAGGITFGNILWAFRTGHTGSWQPLTWLSHMRDCQFFGLNPGWQHFNNTLLHAANAQLLFFILCWFTGERWRSAFVAAVFALHPLNVETVAWIAERRNLLSVCFLLLGLLAYGQFLEQQSRYRYALLVSLFVLGLMASPIIITFPFVLLLIDYWPLSRLELGWRFRELLFEKIPLFAVSLIWSVITFVVEKKAGGLSIFDAVPFPARLANALLSYARYLGKIFWPANLSIPYRYDQAYGALALCFIGILLACITGAVIYFRRKPYLATGWFWYLGTLVLVIGLIQIGPESFADRYAYLPSIGIFIAITWLCADLFSQRRVSQRAVALLGAAVITACVIKTSFQLSYWENTQTLFKHSLRLDPKNYLALETLGSEFVQQKRFDEALECFERVLRFTQQRPFAHSAIASILYSRGEGSEAAEHYEKALGIISPSLSRIRLHDRDRAAVVMNNLAWLRVTIPDPKLRNPDQALRLATKSIELRTPPSAVQLGTLAASQAEKGQFSVAVTNARQALALAKARHETILAEVIQKCIAAYEAGQTVRQLPKHAEAGKKSQSAPESRDLEILSAPFWRVQNEGATPSPPPLPALQQPNP
jgi:protein O-mannosyl-transferase